MIYLALCAMALVVEINLVGRLTVAEILLAAALPVLLVTRKSVNLSRIEKQFYVLAFLWLLSAIVTDSVRQTPVDDVMRGWSKIIFIIMNFTSIRLLVNRNINRSVKFIFFLLIASVVHLRLQPDTQEIAGQILGTGWKFGYGQAAAGATLLLSAALLRSKITRLYGLVLPFLDAIINLVLNARNMFGLTALAALVLAITSTRKRHLSSSYLIAIGFIGVAFGWGALSLYSVAASSGAMGVEAKEKYELQSSGNFGVLFGGRTETFASTQAIADSPILGHGSWARDIHYVELMLTRLEQSGYETQGYSLENDLIPSHSHLLGAWVESGILGAIFWLWVVSVTVRGLYSALESPTPLLGFFFFIGLSFLWDIFFSPFGLERRVVAPAWLMLMILIQERAKNQRLEHGEGK